MTDERQRELQTPDGDFRLASGDWIQLCVVDELNQDLPEHEETDHVRLSRPAVITFGGFSLCREHFKMVTDLIKSGMPMGQVVNLMMTEGLPDPDHE